jgi:hypothetical protein
MAVGQRPKLEADHLEPACIASDKRSMVSIPKAVIYGAALVVVGLVSFALTNPHIGSGIVALGAIWMIRGLRAYL